MVAFEQVNHFVDDDVLQAGGRLFDQFEIEPDTTGLNMTGNKIFPQAPARVEQVPEGLSTYVYRMMFPNETWSMRWCIGVTLD